MRHRFRLQAERRNILTNMMTSPPLIPSSVTLHFLSGSGRPSYTVQRFLDEPYFPAIESMTVR